MDGIDGLIGGVAAMVCLLATAVVAAGTVPLVACVAVACLGFLVWNQAPASVFMGDVGSQFLGLVIGAALLLQPTGTTAVAPVVLLVAPLLLDTGYTLIARAIAGKDILAGHREHLYQRLVVAGRSHREVAAGYIVATAVTGSLAIVWADLSPVLQALAIAAIVAGFVAEVGLVRRAEAAAGVGATPWGRRRPSDRGPASLGVGSGPALASEGAGPGRAVGQRHAGEGGALQEQLADGLVVVLRRRRRQLVDERVDLALDVRRGGTRRPEDPRVLGPLSRLVVVEQLLVESLTRAEAGHREPDRVGIVPSSLTRSRARSTIRTGSPMSRTKTSPALPRRRPPGSG